MPTDTRDERVENAAYLLYLTLGTPSPVIKRDYIMAHCNTDLSELISAGLLAIERGYITQADLIRLLNET